MVSFESIPHEIFLSITRYFSPSDLVHLTRISKRINTLVAPLLWSNIEFHEEGYHESSAELNYPPPFTLPSQRLYHAPSPERHIWAPAAKVGRLFQALEHTRIHDESRLRELASRVKSLCTVISSSSDFWHLLPYFTNLESLELHGNYMRDMEPGFEIKGAPLPRLRFAKLFAYLPRGVARWVLRSGATVERLELGMLDRPISSSLYHDPPNKPLPEDILDGSPDEDYEDWGSLRGEAVIPRPLGGFVPDGDLCLPRLKFLHLCQPSNIHERNGAVYYTWSTRAEKATLADWRRILEASCETLETLVLQQRPGAEQIEGDSTSANEFMEYNTSGYGTGELVDMLEPLILDREAFPALGHVYLDGMAVGEVEEARPVERVPAGRLMLRLAERNVRCEARLGRWCYFASDSGETRWAISRADDDDEDEEDDESDGEERFRWDTVLARV